MAGSDAEGVPPDGVMYCVKHPTTETLLRCSRCLDPICVKCAVRAPVGLHCPKCVRLNRSPLYVLRAQDYFIVLGVGLAVSAIAGALVPRLGLLFSLFLSAPAGGLVAEAILRTSRKRGRPVQIMAAVCIVLGAALGPWLWGVVTVGLGPLGAGILLRMLASLLNLPTLLYTVLAVAAAVARLH
jgi:hypothetical protein